MDFIKYVVTVGVLLAILFILCSTLAKILEGTIDNTPATVVCGKVTEKYVSNTGYDVVINKKLYGIFCHERRAAFATMEIGLVYTVNVANNMIIEVVKQGE